MKRGRTITPEEVAQILELARREPPISYARIGVMVRRHEQTIGSVVRAHGLRRAGK